MSIPETTPLLPQGVKPWGVFDWPSWPAHRLTAEVANEFKQWPGLSPDVRQERLMPWSQNAAMLLRLCGQASFSVVLPSLDRGEGFEWVASATPQQLPWLWGNRPLAYPLPCISEAPLSLEALEHTMRSLAPPEESTGARNSLAWFGVMSAFFSWWDCRLTGRLSSGLRFDDVTVDDVSSTDVVCTGRRFGPSLPTQ